MRKRNSRDRGKLRKEQILRVAARVFAEKGYHATTLDQIAQEIGLSKPALYYYITNKEEMLREVIEMMMKRAESVVAVGRLTLTPREKLAKIVRMIVEFGAEDKEIALIAFEQAKILPEESRNTLKRREKEIEHVVQQALMEGIEQGHFAVSNVKMASFAILAVANWVYRWYKPDAGFSPVQVADQFIELLEHGYSCKE